MGRWLLSALLLMPLAALLQPFVPVEALTGEDGGRLWVWGALYAVASVVAVRDALAMRRRRDLDGLRRAGRFVKLASIPFFIGNFIVLGAFAAGTAFMGIGLVLAPFFVAGTYLVMLPTSVYGLAALSLMRRHRAVSPTFVTVNVVLHLLFVLDVVSSLLVAHRAKQVLLHAGGPSG